MTRTKLKDREMPVYTKKEEMFNMISHIVGGVVGIAGMVLCIIFSALHHNGYGLAGSIVFGVSMILLYTMSSVYHGLKPGMGKRVMQVFDHCTIYVLIAGTYTPLLLSAMRPIDPVASWVLLGIVWGLAAVGIAVTAIDLNKYWFVCADMDGQTMYDLNLTGPIGLVIGNEGAGVSRLVKEKCDFTASIPMKGDIDSLNASVAAGVLAYEIVRQRLKA